MNKKISIGSDHAGFEYKERMKECLLKSGYDVKDCGCYSKDSVDYPDFAHVLAKSIQEGESEFGVLFCGSGNGINISANKNKGIRSALCWMPEIASLARRHNNANVITLPARFVSYELAEQMAQIFLTTSFEGGRHQMRVEKIE